MRTRSSELRIVCGAVLALAALAGPPDAAGSGPRVALLPLGNGSEAPRAPARLRPLVSEQLERIGFEVVEQSAVEEILLQERIRFTDSLSAEHATLMGEALEADYLLLGRVVDYREATPAAGLTLRLVEPHSGRLVWTVVHAATGERYRRWLGRGRAGSMDRLAPRIVEEALATLELDGSGRPLPPRRRRVRGEPLAPDPLVYRRSGTDLDRIRTVGVLPLQDSSGRRGADGIVRDLLVARLWQSGAFDVVESGALREHLMRSRLYPGMVAGREKLGPIRRELGVDAVLSGRVLRYAEPPSVPRPEVELSLQLVSTRDGKILWTGLHARHGDDALTLFGAGRIRTAAGLTEALIDDLLVTFADPKRSYE